MAKAFVYPAIRALLFALSSTQYALTKQHSRIVSPNDFSRSSGKRSDIALALSLANSSSSSSSIFRGFLRIRISPFLVIRQFNLDCPGSAARPLARQSVIYPHVHRRHGDILHESEFLRRYWAFRYRLHSFTLLSIHLIQMFYFTLFVK